MSDNRNGSSNGAEAAAPRTDPALARQVTTLALSTWDLARRRADRELDDRGFLITLRAHQRLVASFERARNIPEEQRSRFYLRPDAVGSCLLIHGISTGPGDLDELGRILHDQGYNSYILRLPDFGRDLSTLSDNSWESYLNQVRDCFRLLDAGPGKVNVIGMGYGATLALLLARDHKPGSLTLLAPALIARESLLQRLLIRLRLHRIGFLRRWLSWNVDLVEGMDQARGVAGRLRIPVFAAQCEDDERASCDSLRFLQRKARHRASRFRLFPEGGHAILASHGEGSLYDAIIDFLGAEE